MKDVPFGVLGPEPFVLQGTDQWYNEKTGKWSDVKRHQIRKWSDAEFPAHTSFRGYLMRLSDGVHESRFLAVYGRPKPPSMYYESTK